MSLLLDALKRAEESKKDPSLVLEPLIPKPQSQDKPNTSGNFNPRDSMTETQVRRPRVEQEAAQTVFDAKQAPPPQNRALWLLLGGLSLLAIFAGVFWLWYMLSFPSNKPPTTIPQNLARQSVTPIAPKIPVKEIQKPFVTSKKPSDSQINEVPIIESSPTPPLETNEPTQKRANRVSGTNSSNRIASVIKNDASVKTINPDLASGYDALINKNYLVAEEKYKQVIQADPFNTDAYLGLATISATIGNLASADNYYRKALEIDPKNATAQAGLAAIRSTQNIAASESQLKAQIASQPADAASYTTLGHIYAAQKIWADAQQAFFEAFRLNPTNADYAFNLAISLDHLRQYKLAREYYDKALTLGQTQPAEFDRAQAISRLNQLPTTSSTP